MVKKFVFATIVKKLSELEVDYGKTRKARLEELYKRNSSPVAKRTEVRNIMEVPKIKKIVLNVGVTGSITDSKLIATC